VLVDLAREWNRTNLRTVGLQVSILVLMALDIEYLGARNYFAECD
jgi:hypothetical protein